MNNRINTILAALQAMGLRPTPSGKGWSACCPAHEDRSPSLSISEGEDGRVLIHCHAGCTPEAVVHALGLSLRDLMPLAGGPSTSQGRTSAHAPTPRYKPKPTYATAQDAVAALVARRGAARGDWSYHDRHGQEVGRVLRWDRADGGKDFLPVSLIEGRWSMTGLPEPRPPYRLPDLLALPTGSRVYVTEGEKCADVVRSLGLPSTTSVHGANSPQKTDWTAMSGFEVVVLKDNDAAGDGYAREVARLVLEAGAASVRLIDLPGVPEGGDIVDFIEARGGDVEAVTTELEDLVASADPVSGEPPGERTRVHAAELGVSPPFPIDALPEPASSFVREGAMAIGCDPSYLALPLICAFASAAGLSRGLVIKRGWIEFPIIWAAVVGDSGTMKTPAFKAAMRAVRKAQQQLYAEYQAEHADWQKQVEIYDLKHAAWKREAKQGAGGFDPPPEKPREPILKRLTVSDATVEALAPIFLANPKGVLIARDELSGWMGAFDRYAGGKGGSDVGNYLSMFNGLGLEIDRKTGQPRTIIVPAAAASIIGGIQPGALERALGQQHRENGLAARLLMTCPPRVVKKWTDAEIGEEVNQRVEEVYQALADLPMDLDEADQPVPRLIRMHPDAKTLWVRFYDEHALEQADLAGDLAAAWSKLECYVPRLALVVHLIRVAAGDPTIVDEGVLDAQSMQAGIDLIRWFSFEARRIYGMLDESDEQRGDRRLIEWIRRRGGAASPSQVAHGIRAFRANPVGAENALGRLHAAGLGVWEHVQSVKGGRPTRQLRLHPQPPVLPPSQHAHSRLGGSPQSKGGVGGVTGVTVTETHAKPAGREGISDSDTSEGVGGPPSRPPLQQSEPGSPCRMHDRKHWWRIVGQRGWTCGACHPPETLEPVEWASSTH